MPFCKCLGKPPNTDKTTDAAQRRHGEVPSEPPKVSKQKIYISRNLPEEAVALLGDKYDVEMWNSEDQAPREKLLEDVKGASAIICTISDQIDSEVLAAAGSQLQVICNMAADYSNIDTQTCDDRRIALYNVADLCADANAEFTVALLLVTARRVMEGIAAVTDGEWGPWKPMWICGVEISGRTLGMLGFGRVGWGVANRMKPFGISRIIYFDKNDHPMAADVDATKVELEDVFTDSDFIVCSLSLTEETKGIVNAQMLALCKPECVFVNTSRGGLVNHDDLLNALQSEQIAAAGLDVTDPEPLPSDHALLKLTNCIITPHMGTATFRTRKRMANHVVNAVLNHL